MKGVPAVAQWVNDLVCLCHSTSSIPDSAGLRIWHCCTHCRESSCSSDWSLAWELSYAMGAAKKEKKRHNIVNQLYFNKKLKMTKNHNEISPVTMAIIKKMSDNKCWWECGEKELLCTVGWECKLVQPLWKQYADSFKNEKENYHMVQQLMHKNWNQDLKMIAVFTYSFHQYSQNLSTYGWHMDGENVTYIQ